MSKILETRKERCRCGTEQRFIKDYAKFGWSFSSKQLLNRFGNPLPADVRLSEAEKREKCFYDLTFIREYEKDTIDQLNSLQNEYGSLKEPQTCFTGKRVTSCVFITIFLLVGIFGTTSTYKPDNNTWTFFLVMAIVALLALAAIIIVGVFRVKKNCRERDRVVKRKRQIEQQVQTILKNAQQ